MIFIQFVSLQKLVSQ